MLSTALLSILLPLFSCGVLPSFLGQILISLFLFIKSTLHNTNFSISQNQLSILLLILLLFVQNNFLVIIDSSGFMLMLKIFYMYITVILIHKANLDIKLLKFYSYIIFFCTVLALTNEANYLYYDPVNSRFGMAFLGSPNSTAFILAFCIVILCDILITKDNKVIHLIMLLILFYAIVQTQSRGGIFLLSAGVLVLMYFKFPKISIVASLILGILFLFIIDDSSRFNLISDYEKTGGTGRFFIWGELLKQYSSSIFSIIFGLGSNMIHIEISPVDSLVTSAHSSFLETIYSFGILGVLLILLFFYMIILHLKRNRNHMVKAFGIMLFISIFIDGYMFDTHLLFFHSLLISLFMNTKNLQQG